MNEWNTPQYNQIAASFQAHLQDEEFFLQVVDLFPMPIEVFAPNGMSVFVNHAFLECFNISNSAQIVGKLNILEDLYVNNKLGLTEYLKRIFAGEILSLSSMKVPTEEINKRYGSAKSKVTASDMYQDIAGFPLWNENGSIA